MLRLLPALLLALLLALPAQAESFSTPPPLRLLDIDWLTGVWEGEHFGSLAVMTMCAPAGNAMAGVYQVVDPDGTCSIIEYDLIEETPEGLFWHYAIYGAGMVPLHETPFGHSGTYRLEQLPDGRLRYWHEDPAFPMKEAFVERVGDNELKSVVVFRGEAGDQTVEFISRRRES